MNKSELLNKIKAALEAYNKNNFVPKDPVVADMWEWTIEILDDAISDPDLAEIRKQLSDLTDQFNGIHPGLSEEEVQAKINAALLTVNGAISRLDTTNTRQDTDILKLQEDILKVPTEPALEKIRTDISAVRSDFDTHKTEDDLRDGKQDADILKLQEDILNIPTESSLEKIRTDISAVRSDFDTHKTSDDLRDGKQDTDILQLQADILKIPTEPSLEKIRTDISTVRSDFDTHKTEDDLRDGKQDADILKLQEDILNIPTESSLEKIRTDISAVRSDFDTHKTEDDLRDGKQDTDIASLNDWRTATITELEGIQRDITELKPVGPELERIKQDVLAPLERWQTTVNADLLLLKDIPGRVNILEEQLKNIKPGIDEATAGRIAQGKVDAFQNFLETRLLRIETDTAKITGLDGRLTTAEDSIRELFRLVGSGGGGGGGTDGVSEAYVQAELRKLEAILRGLNSETDAKYAGLLLLSGEIEKIRNDVATRTTAQQVSDLISKAIVGFVTMADLTALENKINAQAIIDHAALVVRIKEEIRQAYEAYVTEKIAGFDQKISEAEGRLIEELNKIWEKLPEQSFPQGWLDKVLEEAGKLDKTLHTNIVDDITALFTGQWKNEILGEAKTLDNALRVEWKSDDAALKIAILDEVATKYALITELSNEKDYIFKEVDNKIRAFSATLPHLFTKEEIQQLAASEASRLDEALRTGIEKLEDLNIGNRLADLETFQNSIESLGLEAFKNFVTNLDLTTIVSLVNALNTWKQTTAPEVEQLKDDVEAIQKELGDSAATDTANRIARVCLTGWGLAGGLEVFSDKDYCIYISAGQGVTPDGHLIVLPVPASFIGYTLLSEADKKTLDYGFFDDMPVWELIEFSDTNPIDGRIRRWLSPQNNLERDMPFSTDKVVLLLPGPRFLLVQRDDYVKKTGNFDPLRRLMGGERSFEHSDYLFTPSFSKADTRPTDDQLYRTFHPAIQLPAIQLYRFGFRPADDCTVAELDKTDFPSLTTLKDLYDTWKPIVQDALQAVNDQTAVLLSDYHALLFPQLAPQRFQETLDILLSNWKAYYTFAETNQGSINQCYIQYFYDWARDMIRAYHEICAELQDLMAELCLLTPETLSERNRHLALGPAYQPDQDGLAAPLRDTFRQPPVYNGNAARWEKTRLYYRRLFEMIESFYIEGYVPDAHLPEIFQKEKEDAFYPSFDKIKITPGKNIGNLLGEQTIPFYYPLSDSNASLHYYWNYRRTKSRTYDQLRSYHTSDAYDGYNHPDDWHVTRPLYFVLDECDFFRIEGHIGRKEDIVIDGHTFIRGTLNRSTNAYVVNTDDETNMIGAIKYLSRKHNLDFEVVVYRFAQNLTQSYLEKDKSPDANEVVTRSFIPELLGAEHMGGVPRGGTFIVILDSEGVAIADFCVPYRFTVIYEINALEFDEQAIAALAGGTRAAKKPPKKKSPKS